MELNPEDERVLLWPDHTLEKKKIILYAAGKQDTYDITLVGKQRVIVALPNYIHVRTITKNFGRQMIITQSFSRSNSVSLSDMGNINALEELKKEEKKEDAHSKDDLKFSLFLQGIGLSIIDGDPKELLYFSAHQIEIGLEKKVLKELQIEDTNYYLKFNIGHIQLDNMLDKSFPVIFAPQRLFIKDSKDNEQFPFIQTKISYTNSRDEGLVFSKYNSVQLQVSEMAAFIDQELLMNIIKLVNRILAEFKPANKAKYGSEEFKEIKIQKLQELCPTFKADYPEEPKDQGANAQIIFVQAIHLAAFKLRTTIRLDKNTADIGFLNVFSFIYSIGATMVNITDAPLYLKELALTNVLCSPSQFISRLTKNYTVQAIGQLYKLLGAIDIIGNPIGLIDKLGSGVFEFFNEPRKGLMKGPKEFAQGLGKGLKSLVTSVVSGSLNSVSRVTGSLYSIAK